MDQSALYRAHKKEEEMITELKKNGKLCSLVKDKVLDNEMCVCTSFE